MDNNHHLEVEESSCSSGYSSDLFCSSSDESELPEPVCVYEVDDEFYTGPIDAHSPNEIENADSQDSPSQNSPDTVTDSSSSSLKVMTYLQDYSPNTPCFCVCETNCVFPISREIWQGIVGGATSSHPVVWDLVDWRNIETLPDDRYAYVRALDGSRILVPKPAKIPEPDPQKDTLGVPKPVEFCLSSHTDSSDYDPLEGTSRMYLPTEIYLTNQNDSSSSDDDDYDVVCKKPRKE